MNESATFESFFEEIKLDSLDEYQGSIDAIAKKLDSKYYDGDSLEGHVLVVGSVGRGTAVSGTSDLDMLYVLPPDVYKKFDAYEANGQSSFLQEVKETLRERYPRTDIKGDGQAVVVSFTNRSYTIDLVPAFAQSDGSFKHPDTHGSGSWKKTDPVPEQEACAELFVATGGAALKSCNALRVWKNNIGLHFKGLLMDTLVARYFKSEDLPDGYYELLTGLFEFISNEDREKAYWHALGSNQLIVNDDGGAFVPKAKKAAKTLSGALSSEDRESALRDVFGKVFSNCVVDPSDSPCERAWVKKYAYSPDEQFVEDKFRVDISCSMSIDCEVTQDGFRTRFLGDMLRGHFPLLRRKKLRFFVSSANLPVGCDYYWKVRNCGEVAYSRRCVRGSIEKGGCSWNERTDFVGPHFVECYAVKNGICVARSRIDVPIVDG